MLLLHIIYYFIVPFCPNFQLFWLRIPRTLPCTFHNLKSLKLHLDMDFYEETPIKLTFLLLKSAPNLQNLKIMVMVNLCDD
jgi:hypothetical protein